MKHREKRWRMNSGWSILAAALALLLCIRTPLRGDDPARTLASLQEKYRKLKTLSASFIQRYRNGEQVLEESGVLSLKKPGKMYWEYQTPTTKYFLVDGGKSWFYVPRDKQVIVTRIQRESSAPLMLLFGEGDLNRDFIVEQETEEEPATPGHQLLRLVPRIPQGDFSFVLLEIDPGSSLLSRLSIIEPVGGRNDYLFDNIEQNTKVSDRLFKLKVPSGVEIIEQ